MLRSGTTEDLRRLLDSVGGGAAVFDVGAESTRYAGLNAAFAEILGVTSEGARGREVAETWPADQRAALDGQLRRCVETRAAIELDLTRGDARWRLLLCPILDAAGEPVRVMATAATVAADADRRRLESVVNSAYDAIITVDRARTITFVNGTAETMFGYRRTELIGQPLAILIPEEHREAHGAQVETFARSASTMREMQERQRIFGRRRDGTEFAVQISIAKIHLGSRTEYSAVVRDISATVALLDELSRSAATDFLTGLANRRAADARLADEVSRAHRYGPTLSAILFDLDHFKTVNDRHGHATGDDVLRRFASVVRHALRASDFAARVGGEEFLVLLPHTDLGAAREVAERIRARFSTEDVLTSAGLRRFTVSGGVAELASDAVDGIALLRDADRGLYRAKSSGRNRISSGVSVVTDDQPSAA